MRLVPWALGGGRSIPVLVLLLDPELERDHGIILAGFTWSPGRSDTDGEESAGKFSEQTVSMAGCSEYVVNLPRSRTSVNGSMMLWSIASMPHVVKPPMPAVLISIHFAHGNYHSTWTTTHTCASITHACSNQPV